MNIRDGYNSNKVLIFDTQDRYDDKIDKLTPMMSKLIAQGNSQIAVLNPKLIKAKGEDKQEIIIIKANIKIDTNLNSGERRMSYRGRAQYGQSYGGRWQYDHNYRSYIRRWNFRGM